MKKTMTALVLIFIFTLTASCNSSTNGSIMASGTIEAAQVFHLASELNGKITAIYVDKGSHVSVNAVLFNLDDSALLVQRKQAQAALMAAEALETIAQENLDLLKAGSTEEQIKAAQAQLDNAGANRDAIQSSLRAMTSSKRPEEIAASQARLDWAREEYYQVTAILSTEQQDDIQAILEEAGTNLASAKTRKSTLESDDLTPPSAIDASGNEIRDAQAMVDQATMANNILFDATSPLFLQIESISKTWEMADLNHSQAVARRDVLRADPDITQTAKDFSYDAVDQTKSLLDKARDAYYNFEDSDQVKRLKSAWDEVKSAQNDLNALARTPPGSANLESILYQLDAATAQFELADANLTSIKNGARKEQIGAAQGQLDSAKAQMDAAQAALDLIDVQITKLTVKAPASGIVLQRALNIGEMATPGASVIELGALDQVKLTVYIPEDQYGRIKLGQSASIQVDSYPGKTFVGTVSFISDQAEFTPRNVQTVESRSTTVYAIEITLPNQNYELKPGMPADATF